jgi:hypothetical protein
MNHTKTHNTGERSTSRILGFVGSKREEVNRLLIDASNRNQVTHDAANSIRLLNDLLANNLSLAYLKGSSLVKLHALRTPEEVLRLFQKPVTEQEYFSTMSELIEEDELGSKNADVRKTAMDLIRTVARQYVPATATTPLPIAEMYDVGNELIDPEESSKYVAITKVAKAEAQAIFDFVRLRMSYLSEGGENLQRALHTLLVGGGDCDDLAILTASLLRSLGFAVYLKFLPEHVFAGVFVGEVMQVPVSTLPAEAQRKIPEKMIKQGSIFCMQYWAIPLDIKIFHLRTEFQQEVYFDVFDIYSGDYEKILRSTLRAIAEHLSDKDDNELERAMKEFMKDHFSKLAQQVASICGRAGRYIITDGHSYLANAKDIDERFDEQNERVLKGS